MNRSITWKEPFWFFFPLIFTAEMMMISHSVIHAFLARLENPTVTLAAFSLSFIFHAIMGSALWAGPLIAIHYIHDQRAIRRMVWFHYQIALLPAIVLMLTSFTPLGAFLYGGLMGSDGATSLQAQQATAYFALIFLVVPFRNVSAGVLMKFRKTKFITLGTLIRLGSLGGFLYFLPLWFEGATVGALALAGCIATESLCSWVFSLPFCRALPLTVEENPVPYITMWRFSGPLMLSHATEAGIFFVINFFLGRLSRPELAQAAFGVLRGIQMVLLSSLRNLTQTAQTFARNREDFWVMFRFSTWTIGVLLALSLGFFLPSVRSFVLEDVMGLPQELVTYLEVPLQWTIITALMWGYSSLFRGLLLALKQTRVLTPAALWRMVVVAGIGAFVFFDADMNGALIGTLAFSGAFLAETVVLGGFLFGKAKGFKRFPLASENPDPAPPGSQA